MPYLPATPGPAGRVDPPERDRRVTASPGNDDGHAGVAVIAVPRTPVFVHVALWCRTTGRALIRMTVTGKKQVDVVSAPGLARWLTGWASHSLGAADERYGLSPDDRRAAEPVRRQVGLQPVHHRPKAPTGTTVQTVLRTTKCHASALNE